MFGTVTQLSFFAASVRGGGAMVRGKGPGSRMDAAGMTSAGV